MEKEIALLSLQFLKGLMEDTGGHVGSW